ncbi:basic leucine zipper transcriptional factor ATF-like 3 isoform X2 [Cyprinodon tularosa]|uniref:basic leucine zipper transcriptional factor ATF-like 3 isoform X2 n=1 Tax=Cyprinodon tularosa TaxID=77115 RepID=UPI0018E226F1|nr:basic leucine zipper transcriptional factor ATF-like 3 isoform X2 [Cyprinodon tularosa]
MSGWDSSPPRENTGTGQLCEGRTCLKDEGRRLKRREKNRVAAQKSRKRQTQRADQLHQLEQRNRKLQREVDSLSEEQNLLAEALRAHEPFCPIMHCALASPSLHPDGAAAPSL